MTGIKLCIIGERRGCKEGDNSLSRASDLICALSSRWVSFLLCAMQSGSLLCTEQKQNNVYKCCTLCRCDTIFCLVYISM